MGLDIYFVRIKKVLVAQENNDLEKVFSNYVEEQRKKRKNPYEWLNEDFYARKEWWIPEYLWQDNTTDEPERLVLVSVADLDYMIEQYKTAIKEKNAEPIIGYSLSNFDDETKMFFKGQMNDIKRLKKTLADDECVLAYFSW